MKPTRTQYRKDYTDDDIYGPFDFDMHLNIGDYLYLAVYITFALPVILLGRAARALFTCFTGRSSQQKTESPHRVMSHRLHALISKFF